MVHGETETRTVADAAPAVAWHDACDRLGHLIESLLTEHDRLMTENRRLRATAAESRASQKGRAGDGELAQVRRQLEQERRQWVEQRRVIADRLEAILGKFQWLEARQEAAAEAAPAED
jgi:hypothetical protein